jgi:hypothetical protein
MVTIIIELFNNTRFQTHICKKQTYVIKKAIRQPKNTLQIRKNSLQNDFFNITSHKQHTSTNQFETNPEYKTVATTTAIIEADAGIRIHKMNSHGNYNITITQDWKKVFNDEKNKKLP